MLTHIVSQVILLWPRQDQADLVPGDKHLNDHCIAGKDSCGDPFSNKPEVLPCSTASFWLFMSAVNREVATLALFLKSAGKSMLQLFAMKAFPNRGEILQWQM